MHAFGHQDKQKLETFLKYLQIEKMHIRQKRKDGRTVPAKRTIWGLATPGDGTRGRMGERLPNPPVIQSYGAGSKDVKFWHQEGGRHISVYEYFQKGKSSPIFLTPPSAHSAFPSNQPRR